MVMLKGWKFVAMVGSVVGVIGLAIYPIIVSPMVNPEPYSKLTIFSYAITSRLLESPFLSLFTERQQAVNRSGVKQEEIQPGSER